MLYFVSTSDSQEALIDSASALVFTPDSWNTPQTVTVTGVSDSVSDGDTQFYVYFVLDRTEDPYYARHPRFSYSLVNRDSKFPRSVSCPRPPRSLSERNKSLIIKPNAA